MIYKSHSVSNVKLHFVFVTKRRIVAPALDRTEIINELIHLINSQYKLGNIISWNVGDSNHIHLLLETDGSKKVNNIAMWFKSRLSYYLKKRLKATEDLADYFPGWQNGFFVASVGVEEYKIRNYIKNQR